MVLRGFSNNNKMIKYLALLFGMTAFAQIQQDSIQIKGTLIANTKFAKVVMLNYDLQQKAIAVANIDRVSGSFKIKLSPSLQAGVYKLFYSQSDPKEFSNIIIDGKEKEIEFSMVVSGAERNLIFTKSEENKNWRNYNKQNQKQLQKIDVLHQMLTFYPAAKDKIVAQTQLAYASEKQNYKTQRNSFLEKNKNSWAAEMVANNPVYFPDPTEHPVAQSYKQRTNYWNGINTTNPKLINAPLYTEHILNYLKFYMNPEMHYTESEMEIGFKKSADTIMQKFSGNIETKKFALKYLILGFKEIGQEKVLQYLDEKYKETIQQCNNDYEKEEFDKRRKGYENIKIGNLAPEIIFEKEGKTLGLKDITSDKVIIAFWASWCPNCERQMPLLQEYIKDKNNISVLAISLDTNKNEYENAIKKYPNMIHTCDFKKWIGKIVNDYYIYGSPTFILLDKNKKIIGKFTNWEATLKQLEP
jgi:thiol-disulfide isomerase/thioredoxin